MKTVLKWILALAMAAGSFFLSLWVFTQLWIMCVVPLGVRPLTMFEAFGVGIVCSYHSGQSLMQYAEKEKLSKDSALNLVSKSVQIIIYSLISWGVTKLIFG